MNPEFIPSGNPGNKAKRKKNRDSARVNAQQRIIEMQNNEPEEQPPKKEIDIPNIEQKLCIIGIVLFVMLILGGVGYLIYKIKTMYKSVIKTGLNEITNISSDESALPKEINSFTNTNSFESRPSISAAFTDSSKYNDLL